MGLTFVECVELSGRVNHILGANGAPVQVGRIARVENVNFDPIQIEMTILGGLHLACFTWRLKTRACT